MVRKNCDRNGAWDVLRYDKGCEENGVELIQVG